jgi:hypothetical protein
MPITPPRADNDDDQRADEPSQIDLGRRSFAGQNISPDQRDRHAKPDTGSNEEREERAERMRREQGLSGEVPEDALD